MNTAAHCENCKFFDQHKAAAAGESQGLCRYNPPVSQPTQDSRGLWPVVGSSDWCGHFTPEMTPAE